MDRARFAAGIVPRAAIEGDSATLAVVFVADWQAHPAGDLLIGQTISGPQQRPGLNHLAMRQHRRTSHPTQLDPLFTRHQQRRSHHRHMLQEHQANSATHHQRGFAPARRGV